MATMEDFNRLSQQLTEINNRLNQETSQRNELAAKLAKATNLRSQAEARVAHLEAAQSSGATSMSTTTPPHPSPPMPPTPSVGPTLPPIKVATPDKYEGARGALAEAYASQVRIYIAMNKSLFTTDDAKVMFAISYLTGEAIKWAQPFLQRIMEPAEQKTNPVTYLEFTRAFESVFFDSDRQKRAEAALRALKQTNSAAEYTIRFNQLAPTTKWELPTLISHYRQGLKSAVRIPMIRDQFDDLESITRLACAIDNNLRGEAVDPSTITRSTNPDTMDISSARFDISSNEYNQRMSSHLCFKCGKPDHMARWCGVKSREGGRGRFGGKGKIAELEAKIAALQVGLGSHSGSSSSAADLSKNGAARE